MRHSLLSPDFRESCFIQFSFLFQLVPLCLPHSWCAGDAKDWCPAQRHCHTLPSVFPKHGLCFAVSIPPGTEGKDKFSLFTWLGATSCPGMCSCISSCIECSGTSVLLCEVTVSAQTGGNSLQTLCPLGSCSAPFLLYRLFIEGKLLMIPSIKQRKEATSFLSQVQHILSVEISAIEQVTLNLTISNQNYLEEMRAI